MVLTRRIGPGQQLRQDDLAEELGVSRSPLREAMRTLQAEGLLTHVPNQGYFVVRLSAIEVQQIYLMRRLLETELLRTLRTPSSNEIAALWSENDRIKDLAGQGDLMRMLQANRRFHFAIFALSPMHLVTGQVERLWNLSESYRAAYLWLPSAQERVITEHQALIDTLEREDVDRLLAVADQHRSAAEASVTALLQGGDGMWFP